MGTLLPEEFPYPKRGQSHQNCTLQRPTQPLNVKEKDDRKNEKKKSERSYHCYQPNPSLAGTSRAAQKTQKEREWGLVSPVGFGDPSVGGARLDGALGFA